jgi:hypothetical protein
MAGGSPHTIKVNRAPVLTLWAVVVAERLGFTHDEALTLAPAVAGLNTYSKGVSLGLIHPAPQAVREQWKKLQKGKTLTVALLGRAVPVVRTPDGLRTLTKYKPDDPAAVTRYLEGKFGGALPEVRTVMGKLARLFPPRDLAARAYSLYEKFRPAVPTGIRGWGAKGELDLEKLKALAQCGVSHRRRPRRCDPILRRWAGQQRRAQAQRVRYNRAVMRQGIRGELPGDLWVPSDLPESQRR